MTRQERKVLEQALGAMNECLFDEQWYAAKDALKDALEAHKALSAEHVAQPEQKPVAWMIWLEGNVGMFSIKRNAQIEFARRNEAYPDDGRKLIPLYTTPPQRTRAWLTAEQKVALCKKFPDHLTFNAIEAIEDQLKQNNGYAEEKNT